MVRRMSRVRAARIGIGHLFRIAMVGDDQELALDGFQGFNDFADAGVDRFDSFDSAIFYGDTRNVTMGAFISGCKSYVATFGDGTRMRSSPGFGSSSPPLKKYVT